ncbi:hypothetical protein F5879DRAFT_994906 [Lentinula edodes]|nr:hypothetical protein F5879DRAFT_994906 [Lentinula edodes]
MPTLPSVAPTIMDSNILPNLSLGNENLNLSSDVCTESTTPLRAPLRAFRIETASGTSSATCKPFVAKPALNRRSRRRLAKAVQRLTYSTQAFRGMQINKPLIELKRGMSRLPGTAFLGSKAVETMVTVNGFEEEMKLIVDSGADITLISQAALDALLSKPKVKGGQRVSLLQVTGPVKLMVEAYVVNGMTTPFLLGTDFQEQYSLSILRREGQTFLGFGDSGRELEEGTIKSVTTTGTTQEVSETEASSGHHQTARGGACCSAYDRSGGILNLHTYCGLFSGKYDVYGAADTLISRNKPFLHVANFSKRPVVVAEGEVLAIGTVQQPTQQ